MEDLLTNAFQSGNATAIIAAVVVYGIIWFQRNNTKKSRDDDKDDFDKRLAILETKVNKFDELDISARLAAIETSLDYIKTLLESKK